MASHRLSLFEHMADGNLANGLKIIYPPKNHVVEAENEKEDERDDGDEGRAEEGNPRESGVVVSGDEDGEIVS